VRPLGDDLELVMRVTRGDMASFNLLMGRYEQKIMRFIYNIVKDKETAEDLSQEVFIAAYYNLHSYKQKYKFSTWIYQIANNKCIDYLRKNKKLHKTDMDSVILTSKEISPEQVVELKEMKSSLKAFLSTLKDVDKRILALRSSEDRLTFLEIGEILDMSASNVKKRYYKVIDKYEKYKYGEVNALERGVIE
jgi:RNA polymerase sigma-70 factor, ECF subfamily